MAKPGSVIGWKLDRSEREELLSALSASPWTSVLYEAPSRVADTLDDLATIAGPGREAVVARELTKQFENIRRGTVGALAAYYRERKMAAVAFTIDSLGEVSEHAPTSEEIGEAIDTNPVYVRFLLRKAVGTLVESLNKKGYRLIRPPGDV